MKKLLIIDDEQDLLETLKNFFELSGYLVMTAQNTFQAKQKLSKIPDLILLDVFMPEVDGISFCKEIRDSINCPIIFLSAQTDENSRIEGLVAGGDDYLLKPFSLKELGLRVDAHIRREERQKIGGRVAYFGDLVIHYEKQEVYFKDNMISLTKTEWLILELLSTHGKRIFSREDIYEKLWEFDKNGDSAIITEHIRRIRTKIKKYTPTEVIQTVWGQGYKWIG